MASLDDELFPDERPDARHALLDLFPEEDEVLKDKRAQEVLERVQPVIEQQFAVIQEDLDNKIDIIHEVLDTSIEQIQLTSGPKGDKGNKGERGQQGAKGDRGELGFRGPKGEQGEKGDRGPKGNDGTSVKLGDVTEEILPTLIGLIPRGGGNMNRNISIGGNSSVLSRYTDINWKAGSNVTLTYANNDQTHNVDITIAASGGGAGGITRSINSVSINTNAGSTTGTDYVYLCNGTLTITMPDATAGNTNLYTVKNVGTGLVTIATTAAQTIDNQPSIQLGTQYTSVDLESDTANWNIT